MHRLTSIFFKIVVLCLMGGGIILPNATRAGSRQVTAIEDEDLMLAMASENRDDSEELRALLAVLEEETEIATKSKMNNDYVPGMVTVLHGEQLEALGVHTVAEALSLVPGIQMSYNKTGEPSAKVRGIAFPFNAGNIKIMLNTIALSRESSGINSSVLLIPVTQVQRIEVIRGPGSSIYGDFAMTGVVNIITKNTGGRISGYLGDDDAYGGSGHYAYDNEDKALKLNMNISMLDNGQHATAVDTNPDDEQHLGVFHCDYHNFSFTAQGVHRRVSFGVLPTQPPVSGPPPALSSGRGELEASDWVMEGRQRIEAGRNVDLEAYVSYLHNDRESDAPSSNFDGERIGIGMDINWKPWDTHQLLFGLSYTLSDIDDALNAKPREEPTVVSDINRENFSVGIQDQITLTDRFSLTLGGRFDKYDDVGSLFTPRLAGVYRLGEHHVIKAQYSKGFRAPTFFELYTTGTRKNDLDFEVIETTELAYVYRRPEMVGRVTLFHSKIADGIYSDGAGSNENNVDIESKGVELEWEQALGEKFRWLANLSYADTTDERSGNAGDNESLGTADWLGNLAVFWKPLPKYMLTCRLLYVGERHTTEGMKDGYETVDLTLSRTDLFKKGLGLRVGVKNLFDEPVIYLTERATGLFQNEFCGQTFWLQVFYEF